MKVSICSCPCCQEQARKRFAYWQDVAVMKRELELERAYVNKLLVALRWIRAACNAPSTTVKVVAAACDRVLPQFRDRVTESVDKVESA